MSLIREMESDLHAGRPVVAEELHSQLSSMGARLVQTPFYYPLKKNTSIRLDAVPVATGQPRRQEPQSSMTLKMMVQSPIFPATF